MWPGRQTNGFFSVVDTDDLVVDTQSDRRIAQSDFYVVLTQPDEKRETRRKQQRAAQASAGTAERDGGKARADDTLL